MMRVLALVVAVVAAGCGRDTIAVSTKASDDYKHGVLVSSVDKFVAAGRTPDAYADMAQAIVQARPQMDKTVAREAELKLVTRAIHPVQQMQAKSMHEKVD